MNAATVKISINEILSWQHQQILSQPAQKLYEAIWHRVRIKGATTIWMDDVEASVRCRMRIELIPAARVELANVGLVECRQGIRQTAYSYVEQDVPRIEAIHAADLPEAAQ